MTEPSRPKAPTDTTSDWSRSSGPPPFIDPTEPPEPTSKVTPTRDLPENFGNYRILGKLGQGGMGSVYLAFDNKLHRQVALKVPNIDVQTDSAALERFFREARLAATFHHANLCPVYEVGQIDGIPYLTMAYISGRSLHQILRGPTLQPVEDAVRLVIQVALALEEAHSVGVIHRDLKPANIAFNHRREPVVMDFGLAHRRGSSDPRLTEPGRTVGTPAYMPPEQIRGELETLTPGCDIYSLGIILYEMLCGRLPFEGNSFEVCGMALACDPPGLRTHRPELDPRLEQICLKALAKPVGDRYPSMAEFANALQEWLNSSSRKVPSAPAPNPRPGSRPNLTPGAANTPGTQALTTDPSPSVSQSRKRASSRWAMRCTWLLVSVLVVVWLVWITWPMGLPTQPGDVITDSLGIQLVHVPEGSFVMGSDESDADALQQEKPAHQVTISRPFYMSIKEITVAQFRIFVESTSYQTEAEKKGWFSWGNKSLPPRSWRYPGFPQTDDQPVVYVTFKDANKFCQWLSRKENVNYRLPTEAEWEYACRAGANTRFSFGTEPISLAKFANIADARYKSTVEGATTANWDDGHAFAAPVGSYNPNTFRLFDMHGNVREWCSDWFEHDFYRVPPVTNPTGPKLGWRIFGGGKRVVRGGGWQSSPTQARAAHRDGLKSNERDNFTGFRVVRD